MDIKNLLLELCSLDSIGNVQTASDFAARELSNFCEVEQLGKTVIGKFKGQNDYTLMLDAHIDQIGFVVTSVLDNGFLGVAKCGGVDTRHLPAKRVKIHSEELLDGVFTSTPPHLEKEETVKEIGELKIDTFLDDIKDKVKIGDYITFAQKPFLLANDSVCARSLDNRAGVAALLELASRLKGKTLPINIVILFSDAEELGLRGAITAANKITPNEAAVIDVSFGNGPDIAPDKCGILGEGAMIGISPILDKNISDRLCLIAADNNLPYQSEVMGGKTSTNADVITISKEGVPTALLSIPLRNMHTDTEVVKICDIISVCDILEKYILSGGAFNA